MPRLPAPDRKTALLKRQQEIAAQLRQLDAREREAERKADTRRKVIAGALALEHLAKNGDSEFGKVMMRLLDEYVEPRARALFLFLPERDDAGDSATDESPHGPNGSGDA